MSIVTIPKKLADRGDLVVISREEYDTLLENRLMKFKEFIPTAVQKKALALAEKDFRNDKTLSYDQLVRKLGFGN